MTKEDILSELSKLKAQELAEVQAKLDELTGHVWLDDGELSEEDKALLEAELEECKKNPNAGSSWEEVKARVIKQLES